MAPDADASAEWDAILATLASEARQATAMARLRRQGWLRA